MSATFRASLMPAPGVVWGTYPERSNLRLQPLGRHRQPSERSYRALVIAARRAAEAWRVLDGASAATAVAALRGRLRRGGFAHDTIAGALGLVVVSMERALAVTLFDSQLFAAGVLLDGSLAEMATGEGKTCAAAAAAAVAALGGVPVHVITANDYLVARDAAQLRPLYDALGLSVGRVEARQSSNVRRAAYACDIVYCTSRELVFDYLRDRQRIGTQRSDLVRRAHALTRDATERPLLRGLCMAIVDEADSILLDDATVPLMLSQPVAAPGHRAFLWQSLTIARLLAPEKEFHVDARAMTAMLSDAGRNRVEELTRTLPGVWRSRGRREEALSTALAALHAYRRDHEYLVRDGRVEIIDKVTGRAALGRVWSRGLHGLIELKEGCRVTAETRTLGQISYQRFFPRYVVLSGISGTLREARGELRAAYGLGVVSVPLNGPNRRIRLAPRLFPSDAARRTAVIERITELRQAGRPVLIGTDSVATSEALGAELTRRGIPHVVLNAGQDRNEAAVIAQAGAAATVTVSTNMAGRGTDITLGPGVAEKGGLHVISCQHNSARRLDRQLEGRCARQGDPGSVEQWLALGAGLFRPPGVRASLQPRVDALPLPGWVVRAVGVFLQMIEERRHALQRKRLVLQDREWERQCTFAPRPD